MLLVLFAGERLIEPFVCLIQTLDSVRLLGSSSQRSS